MNKFQTREERRQEISLKRKTNIITVAIISIVMLLVFFERSCENDDPPMFVSTEVLTNE